MEDCGLLDVKQAISIDLFNECVVCKFTPGGKGSNDGTKEDLEALRDRRKERDVVFGMSRRNVV